MDAKQQVETYLKTDRTLLGGRNLYNQLPNKNRAFQNTLARFTNTQPNLAKLYYQMAKLVGINEYQLKILLSKPLQSAKDIEVNDAEEVGELTLDDQLLAFNADSADYKSAKKLAKALELKPKSQKKDDIYAALTEARSALVKKK